MAAQPARGYSAGPVLSLEDGWAHLLGGRPAQAQMVFGTLAGAAPALAAPKVGYALAALARGDYVTGERALLRAHAADSGVWGALSRRPEARAAASDLLTQPAVQRSETLRTAMTLLAGPEAPASAPPPASAGEHDYEMTGDTVI